MNRDSQQQARELQRMVDGYSPFRTFSTREVTRRAQTLRSVLPMLCLIWLAQAWESSSG